MSAPEEKARSPSPRTITMRMSLRLAAEAANSEIACHMGAEMALRRSGLRSRKTAILSSTVIVMSPVEVMRFLEFSHPLQCQDGGRCDIQRPDSAAAIKSASAAL